VGTPAALSFEPVRKPYWATTKGLRVRMGMTPAEIAEGAEGYWEGEMQMRRGCFLYCLGLLKRYI
jgi:hypothetical protein